MIELVRRNEYSMATVSDIDEVEFYPKKNLSLKSRKEFDLSD
jgi:hypothetical protein